MMMLMMAMMMMMIMMMMMMMMMMTVFFVQPGSSAFSESWLGPAANFLDEDQVSLVVSVVVVAVAAVCSVIVQASLGHTSCTTEQARK